MADLLADNGEPVDRWDTAAQLGALAQAGQINAARLAALGRRCAGAAVALAHLAADRTIVSSVLTGNIEPNARVKLAAFGLDHLLDFRAGAFGLASLTRADLVPVAQAAANTVHGFDPVTNPTVLIGDTARDVRAGLDGGARVLAVASGSASVDELLAAGAHEAIPGLTDLDRFLAALDRARSLGPVPAP